MNSFHDWPYVRLEAVVESVQPGFAQSPGSSRSNAPQLRTNNVSRDGELDLSELKYVYASEADLEKYGIIKGDVIFNNTNSPELVGKTAYFDLDRKFVLSNHMTRIRVQREVLDVEFLAKSLHYLWLTGALGRVARQWVSQAAIGESELLRLEIALPPLPEQRRIVAILRHSEALRRQRRSADEQAEKLVPAMFYEMFGDPVVKKERWHEGKLSEFVDITASLVDPRLADYSAFPHVGSDNIQERTGELINLRPIGEVGSISGKYLFTGTDVLYSKIRPALRKVATPDFTGLCSADIYPLSIDNSRVTRQFVAQLLRSNHFAAYAIRVSGRAQIPKVNREDLLKYVTVVPDIDLQMEFERRVQQVHIVAGRADPPSDYWRALADSLMAHAFSGELTESWRQTRADALRAAAIQRDAWLEAHGQAVRPITTEAPVEVTFEFDATHPRYQLLRTLSLNQLQVYQATLAAQNGYFTAQSLADASEDLDLDVVVKGIALLEAVGLVMRVSVPVRPVGDILYREMYRAVLLEDDGRVSDLERLQVEFPEMAA